MTNASPYTAGTGVSIKAVAAAGYRFVNWTAPAGGFVNANAAETTFTMPTQDVTVTANFAPFAGGSGTKGDPYQIANWHHLHNVRNYLDSYFILVNNLDSTTAGYTERASPTANGEKGWLPIPQTFTGTFDGQGYEIRDLFINRPNESLAGLFNYVDVGGVIKNVGVVNAHMTGNSYIGLLVGENGGTVSNSYATGNVTGTMAVGGLVGVINWGGTVSNSYFTGSVTGEYAVGGLVGYSYNGTVSNSYSTGNVTGGDTVGGLVGENGEGTVSNSYSSGNVIGNNYVGGLVGSNWLLGTVSNSFWDTETSGQATSDGGTGENTTQMKDITTFSGAGWNITTVTNPSTRNLAYIWNIVDDETYPFLSWQPV